MQVNWVFHDSNDSSNTCSATSFKTSKWPSSTIHQKYPSFPGSSLFIRLHHSIITSRHCFKTCAASSMTGIMSQCFLMPYSIVASILKYNRKMHFSESVSINRNGDSGTQCLSLREVNQILWLRELKVAEKSNRFYRVMLSILSSLRLRVEIIGILFEYLKLYCHYALKNLKSTMVQQ